MQRWLHRFSAYFCSQLEPFNLKYRLHGVQKRTFCTGKPLKKVGCHPPEQVNQKYISKGSLDKGLILGMGQEYLK